MSGQETLQPARAQTTPPAAPPGLLRRLAIICYDGLLLFAVLFAATAIVLPLNRGQAFAPQNPLYSVYLLVVSFFYFGWFWTHGGQTLGMRAWGVRLLGRRASRVSWRECLVRYLAALLSLIPFGVGFLWAGVDREKRAWHDRISGTRLVVQPGLQREIR
ncbi:MAG TPA: RDD family protein [Gammaproteobacteria bacterium]|nr:RDD family protein [Gammaproteobacteria bacterium]